MSTPPAENPLPAVVLGGGLAGLAAARLLRRHFPRVVVLERDRRPETASPEDAFAAWERRGVPQFRHSHAFLARLRVVLLAHVALGVTNLDLGRFVVFKASFAALEALVVTPLVALWAIVEGPAAPGAAVRADG